MCLSAIAFAIDSIAQVPHEMQVIRCSVYVRNLLCSILLLLKKTNDPNAKALGSSLSKVVAKLRRGSSLAVYYQIPVPFAISLSYLIFIYCLISPYNVLYRAGIYLFFISRVALARSRRLLYIALKGDRLAHDAAASKLAIPPRGSGARSTRRDCNDRTCRRFDPV